MSESSVISFESQRQRWLKYGANVAISIVIVIALAILVTWLAERIGRRIDTTESGAYSLKPQTVNLIRDNKQKIHLVSLYAARDTRQKLKPYTGPVNDLLQEYARKGRNIDAESIDPITQPAKTDELVGEAMAKYGGAVKAYREFVDGFLKDTFVQIQTLSSAEAAALADVRTEALGNDERGQTLGTIVETIRERVPQSIARIKEVTDRALRPRFPDYKAIVTDLKEGGGDDSLEHLSSTEAAIIKLANQYKDDQQAPPELRKYFAQSIPRHEQIKQLADESMKRIDGLGELKIRELQQAIKGQDLILVLGENDWRVINFDQVWTTDTRDLRAFADGRQIKPRFAGEQAVTTAILSLTQEIKPKVVFIRTGGAPLTSPGFPPFQRGGPFSEVAERLRSYNFDVLEKDITGTWPMQAQMQGMPAAPEPADKELEDAVWIVIDMPPDQRMPMQHAALGDKLAEHLKRGGAAMVLALPQSDNLESALRDLGVKIVPDAIIVHGVPEGEVPRANTDLADEAQRLPYVFVVSKYGNHALTQPVESLDTLLVGAVPVQITPAVGIRGQPLLTIPQFAPVWGERDIESLSSDAKLKFDEGTDVPAPLAAGAVVERSGGSRLVVIGALQSFMNQIMTIPDVDLLRRSGIYAARFPGNGELFVNSVFWLARMDSMIAISPRAMDVPRISAMSEGTITAWRAGLMFGLPLLVLAAGVMMYLARRG